MNGDRAIRAVRPLPWPADATLELPGSKSEANRVLIAAATSGAQVRVLGATPCDDVRHLVAGLGVLGHAARFADEARGVVDVGPRAGSAPAAGELRCGNAGTALRFLVSLAAITPGEWTITGDHRMQRRPIGPLVAAWRQLGASITDTDGCPPVRVRGGAPRGGTVRLDASVSSQFVSSLLLVGATLPDGLQVEFAGPLASAEYAELTCDVLRRCGVRAALHAGGATVGAGAPAPPPTIAVAGDWSAFGTWACLSLLTGSRIQATNLRTVSHQPDEQFAAVLARFAAPGDRTIDVSPVPDQFLALAVVAALRPGTTRLTGAANLRHKECDRIAVMARELRRVGARIDELADGLVVHGGAPLHGATIDPEGDHRVAMAFALLGLVVPGIAIADPGCVAKSYPTFWDDLEAVSRSLRCVAVIGMRGAGKSTFGQALAERVGCAFADVDRQFEKVHGPIGPFVAARGWPAFRAEEARLVGPALAPGRVVALGGGAIEDPATRALLRERTLTVWLDAPAELLRARLAADPAPRPSLTGAPVADELAPVLARRRPLYAAAAHLRIDAALPTAAQVDAALAALAALARR